MIKNTQTKKLALSYLAIIMTLSLLFSVLIYFIISSSLDKPLPIDPRPQDFSLDLKDHFQTRDVEVKNSILLFLGILNLIILFTGYWISQILARRTLAPIERSIRKQSQFISDASHELKTPLAAMLINNEVALRKNNLTMEKARETISKNITEIERLKNLINHMLLLARDDKKELESKINIQDLLESLVNNFRVIAKTKNIELVISSNVKVATIAQNCVSQIISIFIDNAIKYSPPQSSIEITVIKRNKKLVISIRDHGVGIEQKKLQLIFDRFYRVESARTRNEYSSHGLGLAIAKDIAEKQGYTITVKSKVGLGSTFSLIC